MAAENGFGGEVVLIYLVNPPDDFIGGIPVVDPVIEEKEGCKFVVGRIPSDPRDWSADMPVGVALNQISHYLVFSSHEEFLRKSDFLMSGDNKLH